MERRFLRISRHLGIGLDAEGRATFDSASGQSGFAAKAEVEKWQEQMSEVLALLESCDPAKVRETLNLAEQWLQAFEVTPEPSTTSTATFKTPKYVKGSPEQRGRDSAIKGLMMIAGWSREEAEAQLEEMFSRARESGSSEDSGSACGT